MVERRQKDIGALLRNKVEEGDELCIRLEDGQYYNKKVSYTREPEVHEKEVCLSEIPTNQLILVVDVEEKDYDFEWHVWAYKITQDPMNPMKDLGDVEMIHKIGNTHGPDGYVEDEDGVVVDELDTTELREAVSEIEYIIKQIEKAKENKITLGTLNDRLAAYEVKQGGLTLDQL